MAQTNRIRRSPLRPIRMSGISTETSNTDGNTSLNASLNDSSTSLDEHVIRMRTLRSSPRRRSSILSTSEMSLQGSPGISPDSSFDTTFDTSFGSDISASTPLQGPRIQTDKIRKRLLMNGPEDLNRSLTKNVQPSKRKKTRGSDPTWKRKLSALTQDQLVNLFEAVVKDRPELQQDLERLLPAPDVSPLLSTLEYFRHNIYKSLPNSGWGSRRDSFCYRRVKTHLDNFKNSCVKQAKQLLEVDSWDACIEYTLKAVDYVDRLPDWDDATHNKIKQQCYRGLATQCKAAVKHSSLEKERYMEVKAQLNEAIKMAIDFCPILDIVEKKISKCSK